MKIGVSSQNFKTVTGHAGKARRFLVFARDKDNNWRETDRLELPIEMAMHAFRGTSHPLDQLDILITASCGQGFIRRLAGRGVTVLTTGESDPLVAVAKLSSGRRLQAAHSDNRGSRDCSCHSQHKQE